MLRRKAKHEEKEWQVSYIDLLTAMIASFTLLLTMSKPDQSRLDVFASSVETQKKKEVENLSTLSKELSNSITQDSSLAQQASVVLTDKGVEVRFRSGLLFSVGKASLQPEGYDALNKLAPRLRQFAINRNAKIAIEGHTDDQALIGGREFRTNWELSTARAANVLHFLEDSTQFLRKWLSATGYADSMPESTERDPFTGSLTEAARALNRRVVLRIYYNATP